MKHPAHTYRQFAVQGATAVGSIVMLYDGAITGLQRAITAIEARDIEKKCAHLSHALAIVVYLEGILNLEQGGEIARNLKRFYMHARGSVLEANIENSKEILTSLIRQFSELRAAWQQVEAAGWPPNRAAPAPKGARPSSPPSLIGAGKPALRST